MSGAVPLISNFYPRPPRGGRRFASFGGNLVDQFLSTPSARRATRSGRCLRGSWSYFYPRPPRGGRPATSLQVYSSPIFLSTPSARRATSRQSSCCWCSSYFYPRPPRGGRLSVFQPVAGIEKISIHALREEGDLPLRERHGQDEISIHALREEGDRNTCTYIHLVAEFLSTPSARRATP